MTIGRAKEIHGLMVDYYMISQGMQSGPIPDLSKISLKDMVGASIIMCKTPLRKENESTVWGMICDDITIATMYIDSRK